MKIYKNISVLILTVFSFTGCTADYGQYAQAVKEQNMTLQLKIEQRAREKERSRQIHEEKMAKIAGELVKSAAKTNTPNDDMMVPLMLMIMEDKYQMAEVNASKNANNIQLQTIAKPDSIGDTIQKSTGLALGIAGIGLGMMQSNNMKDIAVAGIAGAGVHNTLSGSGNTLTSDSNKTGSQNVVSGQNNSVQGGNANCPDGNCNKESKETETQSCEQASGYFVDENNEVWVSQAHCSCNSWLSCHCPDDSGAFASGCSN